jgi:hypothetical protein
MPMPCRHHPRRSLEVENATGYGDLYERKFAFDETVSEPVGLVCQVGNKSFRRRVSPLSGRRSQGEFRYSRKSREGIGGELEAGLNIGAPMATAIEQIVNIFVSLGNRRRLEDMKLERERAVLELQS